MKKIALIFLWIVTVNVLYGQPSVGSVKYVNIYFQSISYVTNENIASTLVIHNSYCHRVDSLIIPKEGRLLVLPQQDLIFSVTAKEAGYKPKRFVRFADELVDSIHIKIDPVGLSRCGSMRPIHFGMHSAHLDSVAISELKSIKRAILLSDDSTHRFVMEIHPSVDVLEKANKNELLKNRANAVKDFLNQNNQVKIVIKTEYHLAVAQPKTAEEHAANRSVYFKVGRIYSDVDEIKIKE